MHDRDVRGQPWSPCPHCPHATPGACPSRFHRRYCELTDPSQPDAGRYRAIVASLPPEDRPAQRTDYVAEAPPEPYAATSPTRPAGAAPPQHASDVDRPAPADSPEAFAQVRLEVLAMTSCPYRGRKVECGCNGARLCLLLRGDSGRVTALDCQRCDIARADLLSRLGRMLPAP